jgi:hypothetical protein
MEDAEIERMLRRFYPSAEVLAHHTRELTRAEEERIAAKIIQLSRRYSGDEASIRRELDQWCRKQGL